MMRRWAVAGSVICAGFIAGALLLWGRSFVYSDSILYFRGKTAAGFICSSSACGLLVLRADRPTILTGLQWNGHPLRQLAGGGHPLHGMLLFSCNNWAGRSYGAIVKQTTVMVPIWFPMVILGFAGWICFRAGGNVRFVVRDEIRWLNPRLQTKIVRFAVFCAAGAGIGAGVEGLNIALSLRSGAAQLLVTGFAALSLISVIVLFTRRRIQWHRAILWLLLEVAGCVCFFSATMDAIWRHFGSFGLGEPDLWQGALIFGVGCFLGGVILLRFLQLKPAEMKPGPYCRGCGYCLIGVPQRVCPECGRGFTIEELGVSEEVLDPRFGAPGPAASPRVDKLGG